MERVTVTVERSEEVRVDLALNGVWVATPVSSNAGPSGRGDTPQEALADYRRKLEAEVSRVVEAMQVLERRGECCRGVCAVDG